MSDCRLIVRKYLLSFSQDLGLFARRYASAELETCVLVHYDQVTPQLQEVPPQNNLTPISDLFGTNHSQLM
jgi:hypothetical protein